jgi:hypothetical protein
MVPSARWSPAQGKAPPRGSLLSQNLREGLSRSDAQGVGQPGTHRHVWRQNDFDIPGALPYNRLWKFHIMEEGNG